MPESVLQSLRDLYAAHGVAHREIEHAPTRTSEESAQARGEELRTGGKALVMKADDAYSLFVLPADRKIDSAAVRRELDARKLRFASREELHELTGLPPGSVPPFGRPVLPFDLFCDESLRKNDRIAFNAGSLTVSHVLSIDDYLRLAGPRFFRFAAPE
ncbi:MAG: YbaK/EbsC family protein [Planctomycetaceae bacterium]